MKKKKYKQYTSEEVDKFLDDEQIDFEDDELVKAIKRIVTKEDTILEFDNLPNEDDADLIIRIHLT